MKAAAEPSRRACVAPSGAQPRPHGYRAHASSILGSLYPSLVSRSPSFCSRVAKRPVNRRQTPNPSPAAKTAATITRSKSPFAAVAVRPCSCDRRPATERSDAAPVHRCPSSAASREGRAHTRREAEDLEDRYERDRAERRRKCEPDEVKVPSSCTRSGHHRPGRGEETQVETWSPVRAIDPNRAVTLIEGGLLCSRFKAPPRCVGLT